MKIWHSLYRAFMAVFRRILFIWFRTETLQPQLDRLRELAGGKPVCYVLETPSLTDMAVLQREVAKAGLAPPLDGLDAPLNEWRWAISPSDCRVVNTSWQHRFASRLTLRRGERLVAACGFGRMSGAMVGPLQMVVRS